MATWQRYWFPLCLHSLILLEHFYSHRILDPDAWLALADDFERNDRPNSATGARRRLATFQ
jgi:hypothetical protein